MNVFSFTYNVSLKTINCINAINYTYHINDCDYPILHSHLDYFEFTYLESGRINNFCNNKDNIIEKGYLFISSPIDVHSLVNAGNDNIKLKNIVVRSTELERIVSSLYPGFYNKLLEKKNIYKIPLNLIDNINTNLEYVNSLDESNWRLTNEVLKSIIVNIINYLYLEDIKIEKTDCEWQDKLNNLKTNEEFFTYNVNELCEKLGISRTQLNRIFDSEFKMTPHDYLLHCKMEYAASLLAYTKYSIQEICKLIGYTNINQFNTNFKNKYGITPLQYRNK